MDNPGKISLLPLLLTIIFALLGIVILLTFIWHANYAFALEGKNDNIINDTNITKKKKSIIV